MTLRDELAETEARAAVLRQRIAYASCVEAGHDWHSIGGTNAGCAEWCACSVPVRECRRCGDSDYGDTPERDEIIRACREQSQ